MVERALRAGWAAACCRRRFFHAAAQQALADPQVKERLAALGTIGTGTDPQTFAGSLAGERALMARPVREHNIGLDRASRQPTGAVHLAAKEKQGWMRHGGPSSAPRRYAHR
jgi:hypothetical protein